VNEFVNRFRKFVARRPDFSIEIAFLVAALALYLRTMPPTVLDGDSGEFQYMAYILGVAHSSGYPLYLLLGKLFTFLPVNDVAFRVNLLSVVCTALAVPLVYAVAIRVIRARVPAVLTALILAVTPSIWGGALETKPYALHLLLGVLALLFALRWHQDGNRRDFYALALVFGLGLANHHVIAFTAPAFALVVWFNRARLNRGIFVRGALLGLVPLLLYAYIPIRANYFISQQEPANWQLYQREDAILKGTVTAYYINTPRGFFNLVTGLDNSYKLGFTSSSEQTSRIDSAVSLLLQQFNLVGIALALIGAVESFRRDRKLFMILLLYGGGVGFIAVYLRAMISTVYYFSLTYFILAIWIGFGIALLMRQGARVHRAAPAVIVIALLALPISALVTNFPALDESQNYAARDYAQAVLHDHLAPNAVVLAPWEVSQPMRYFQFVENERPDLLISNVSPVLDRQFFTMLENAHKQDRPFYWVQFDPELETPGVPRFAQAVPLPLMQEPQPKYRLQNARIVDQVQVLGYDLEPDPPQPGKPTRLLVYYRADARMYPMYSASLHVTDVGGRLWGDYDGFPGTFYFPTFRWYELGEYYRDTWSINLPVDAPAGLYNLDLSWYVYNLATGKRNDNQKYTVSLGTIRVGDISGDAIAHAQDARVGDAITFLGWDSEPAAADGPISVTRGQSLDLDLFWRGDRTLPESYTVFVHLTDASGRVVATADSPPSQGDYPTDRWTAGEQVRDRHTLKIPGDLAPGNYSIEVGMYTRSTGARLPIGSTDKMALTQVSVH
jgi:Protein O-mannosyl-transferase TMEM260-like